MNYNSDRAKELIEIYDEHLEKIGIPKYMSSGITLYLLSGIEPGSFFRAVLENDLYTAVVCADSENIHLLRKYRDFIYFNFPTPSFGSKAKVNKWIARGGMKENERMLY